MASQLDSTPGKTAHTLGNKIIYRVLHIFAGSGSSVQKQLNI